ncbi:Uncharacterized protein PBTT_00552 [Plasmodiophora brassicae]|uniref:Uncharacterized protein n=1 Tax=Plasmodiophora brassicae TaxID=37360 RepID=A0A0G4IM47_PLABS|nr:hypothetical protein PBRA_004865 [Plasmodiophora brassicae]SPQ93279.1 unnamed protein product [Plasmodiophora brassicae]
MALSEDDFRERLLESLSSLRHMAQRVTVAADALDLKVSDLLDAQLESDDGRWPRIVRPPVLVSAPVESTAIAAAAPASVPDSPKLLFTAMKQVLYNIRSRYDDVDTLYDEVKMFVAVCILSSPEITPTFIVADHLIPYLSMTLQPDTPSMLEQTVQQLSNVTGCSDADARRTLKRIVDNHHRGFKRKPATIEAIPNSMRHLISRVRVHTSETAQKRARISDDALQAFSDRLGSAHPTL